VGYAAGYANDKGTGNTFVGYSAGALIDTGYYNTFMGMSAGYNNTAGEHNTFVGAYAGNDNQTGVKNTYLGRDAGAGNISGSNNVLIGYRSGLLETGSNKLYIANDQFSSNTIIYGDFSTGRVGLGTLSPSQRLHVAGNVEVDSDLYAGGSVGIGTSSPSQKLHVRGSDPVVLIDDQGGGNTHLQFDLSSFEDWEIRTGANGFFVKNIDDATDYMVIRADGKVGIGTTSPSYELDVAGDIECTTLHETSDRRLKANIGQLTGALERVHQLRGVSFQWRQEVESENTGAPRHIGVVAQEVEEVFPELVSTPESGYKSVEYSKLTAVLIEAMKEQQQLIESQQKQIEKLTHRLDDLEK
jgi:hypothetical protein